MPAVGAPDDGGARRIFGTMTRASWRELGILPGYLSALGDFRMSPVPSLAIVERAMRRVARRAARPSIAMSGSWDRARRGRSPSHRCSTSKTGRPCRFRATCRAICRSATTSSKAANAATSFASLLRRGNVICRKISRRGDGRCSSTPCAPRRAGAWGTWATSRRLHAGRRGGTERACSSSTRSMRPCRRRSNSRAPITRAAASTAILSTCASKTCPARVVSGGSSSRSPLPAAISTERQGSIATPSLLSRCARSPRFSTRFESDGAFERYRAREAPFLGLYATFAALVERHGANWRAWPRELRSPAQPAVARFRRSHARRVRFHEWLQWLIDEQLRRPDAASRCSAISRSVSTEVGPTPGSGKRSLPSAWASVRRRIISTRSAKIGGSCPSIPNGLRGAGYEPFIRIVRSAMRHMGGHSPRPRDGALSPLLGSRRKKAERRRVRSLSGARFARHRRSGERSRPRLRGGGRSRHRRSRGARRARLPALAFVPRALVRKGATRDRIRETRSLRRRRTICRPLPGSGRDPTSPCSAVCGLLPTRRGRTALRRSLAKLTGASRARLRRRCDSQDVWRARPRAVPAHHADARRCFGRGRPAQHAGDNRRISVVAHSVAAYARANHERSATAAHCQGDVAGEEAGAAAVDENLARDLPGAPRRVPRARGRRLPQLGNWGPRGLGERGMLAVGLAVPQTSGPLRPRARGTRRRLC